MTGTLKDISQIKKADERLKLFAKCIENISDAVVIYDRENLILLMLINLINALREKQKSKP